MPGEDLAGVIKSIMDNAKDLEHACFPEKAPQPGQQGYEDTTGMGGKDPIIVLETDTK